MTEAQDAALRYLHERYRVPYTPERFAPAFDLPDGWVSGWVGDAIYVGVSPEGEVHS